MKDQDRGIRIKRNICIVLGIICLLLFAFWIILKEFTVTTVYVEGNRHYSAAEIRRMVESGWFGDNSIMLSLKYSNKSITNIPFIERMDVSVEDRNTIKITVYEKALAGYIRYLDRYMYFDKDGIVVESASIPTVGLPMVTGLKFDHLVMYEPLPVEDSSIFQTILNVTKILGKYEIETDRIFFNENAEMTLYFGNVRAQMGKDRLLEEKIQQLKAILPSLEGKSGVLEMANYESDSTNITFQSD
ncbi:MAG: FtsQ-type POTRA domain-containing protein [Lachnospiraceae bacterium]|nr:FtsQ-type POTRA domain-containing protein [Lachnospiraceae bacterium]